MRRRRWLWISLLAAPLLLLAADTLYWWIAVRQLEQGFAVWEARLRGAGWSQQHASPTRGGWPLAATLTIRAVSLAGPSPDIRGRLAWSAERLVLRVELAHPAVLEVIPGGLQHLRADDYPEVPFTAERLRLRLPVRAAPWPSFADIVARNLHADTPLGEASLQDFLLHLDFTPEAKSGEPALAFALNAEGVSPPSGIVRPLGPRITSLGLEGVLSGPMPVGRTMADQVAAWRDAGGSIEIRHLSMVWGPLDLSGSATLALDDQLQPMGAGSARLVGYAETLDALAAHVAISRSAAIASKAVLSLLAHNPDDGGPPDVEVPLTLQYRTLSMRQVPLVRLPEVDWP
jgi:Uncharacterized protein conserved in bacteria (DUF2125)